MLVLLFFLLDIVFYRITSPPVFIFFLQSNRFNAYIWDYYFFNLIINSFDKIIWCLPIFYEEPENNWEWKGRWNFPILFYRPK